MNSSKLIFLLLVFLLQAAAILGQKIPPTAPNAVDQAAQLFQNGDSEGALRQLEQVLQINPRNSYALFLRGAIKFVKNDMDGAFADTEMAIKLAPKVAGIEKAYNNRGAIFQFQGESERALADFEMAISINPNYAAPYNGRGVILENKGKIAEAAAAFDKAIALDPRLTGAFIGRGDIRFQRSELDLALSDFNRVLELYPDDAAVQIRRGYVQGLKGRWEAALADMRKGFEIERDPQRKYRGILSVTFADADKYISLNPTKANAFAARGFLRLLRQQDAEAQLDFERSFELNKTLKSELEELIDSVKQRR